MKLLYDQILFMNWAANATLFLTIVLSNLNTDSSYIIWDKFAPEIALWSH